MTDQIIKDQIVKENPIDGLNQKNDFATRNEVAKIQLELEKSKSVHDSCIQENFKMRDRLARCEKIKLYTRDVEKLKDICYDVNHKLISGKLELVFTEQKGFALDKAWEFFLINGSSILKNRVQVLDLLIISQAMNVTLEKEIYSRIHSLFISHFGKIYFKLNKEIENNFPLIHRALSSGLIKHISLMTEFSIKFFLTYMSSIVVKRLIAFFMVNAWDFNPDLPEEINMHSLLLFLFDKLGLYQTENDGSYKEIYLLSETTFYACRIIGFGIRFYFYNKASNNTLFLILKKLIKMI